MKTKRKPKQLPKLTEPHDPGFFDVLRGAATWRAELEGTRTRELLADAGAILRLTADGDQEIKHECVNAFCRGIGVRR